jgi:hypothetical protein
MAKPGPKRKVGKRFKDGRLDYRALVTKPTAELVAKRVARLVIAGADPYRKPPPLSTIDLEGPEQEEFFRLAASWLGVLYAAGVIDGIQFKTGNNYHEIYLASHPQGFPGSVLDPNAPEFNGVRFQQYQSDTSDDVDLAMKASNKVLKALGQRTYNLVRNVCVFGRFQRFIDTSSPRPTEAWRADSQDKTRFLCGLDALAMAYGYRAAPKIERLAA